jgi:hypothetical protein
LKVLKFYRFPIVTRGDLDFYFFTMRVTKKHTQELQPNKICKCGACEPRKPKLPRGMRRLKVYYKAGYTETIPVILLQGEWIRKLGFNVKDHVIVSERKGQLIINLEAE